MKYAIINLGGKQLRVEEGGELEVDRIETAPGKTVTIDEVLMYRDGDKVVVGNPKVKLAVVLEVIEEGRGQKVRVAKFKAKSRYRKVQGHRQAQSRVKVVSIGGKKVAAKVAVKKSKKSK